MEGKALHPDDAPPPASAGPAFDVNAWTAKAAAAADATALAAVWSQGVKAATDAKR